MFDILVMLFFFVDAVVIHVFLCRKYTGEGLLLKPFIGIALVNLIIMWMVFWGMTPHFSSGDSSIWNVRLSLSATLLYLLLIPTYLVFYFSTQQMSPTKKILLLLREGPLTLSDLYRHFGDDEFIQPRLNELVGIQCLIEHNGWYVITPQGLSMARVYVIYQTLLGRQKGG